MFLSAGIINERNSICPQLPARADTEFKGMKKLIRFLALFLFGGIILGAAMFFALAMYYRNNFPVNTWINGVYCTGKTVEQVNEELVNAQEASTLYVVDADGVSWEIAMLAADVRPDFTVDLKKYLKQNATFYWLENLQRSVHSELSAERYTMDEGKLRECFEELPFVAAERERAQGVFVRDSADGYYLQDDNSMRLDREKAFTYMKDCLSEGRTTIDFAEGDCYGNVPDSESDQVQRKIWEQISEFTDRCGSLAYDMGTETLVISSEDAAGFLEKQPGDDIPYLDEEGKLAVNEEAVREWVERLASSYDTWGTEREFESTRGDTVTVKYVTYGTQLDVGAETEYLLGALQGTADAAGTMPHVPAYTHQGYVRGQDDIGGTYIEIDMTEQKMYYYEDGEMLLETDVVTGNTGRRMGTPQGINFVYAKQRNRTLRGANYASFVKYWMPVKGNVGIHDASWRAKFGGQIYKTNGSHGCINTPTDKMSELYEMVEVGTPVIMFY